MKDEILEEYLEEEIKNILNEKFNISEVKQFNKYNVFFTPERLYEINTFKGYGLISSQIYNVIYLYLKDNSKYSKEEIINRLRFDVDFNKNEMKKINENSWSIVDYRDYKYRLLHPEEEKVDIAIIEDESKIAENENSNKLVTIIQEDENIISIIEYRYCTKCGLLLDGQVPTIMGVKSLGACSCKQKYEPIYSRDKSFCGKCGNHLKHCYCSYCGTKNY